MIFFVYKELQSGGVETLIARVQKWFSKHTTAYIYCSKITGSFEEYLQREKVNYKIVNKKIFAVLIKDASNLDTIYCFTFQDYLKLILLKRICNKKVTIVLYVLHDLLLTLQRLKNYKWLELAAKSIIKPVVKRGMENHSIIFMEYEGVNITREYYGILDNVSRKLVFPLPLEVDEFDISEAERKIQKRREQFTILAIARADFPFKGYLLGLVDTFEKLAKEYDFLELTIISHGRNIELLSNKINRLDTSIKNRVKLIAEVPYDALNLYYRSAHLYVGMGTTLIEAAKNAVVSLVSKCYSNELYCHPLLFNENPMYLGGLNQDEFIDGITALKRILEMDDNTYRKCMLESREQMIKNYEISYVLNRMIKYNKINM